MHFYFTSTSITHANLSLSKTYSASITLPKLAALKSKSSAQKRELISGKLDQRLIPPRKPGHVSLLFFFVSTYPLTCTNYSRSFAGGGHTVPWTTSFRLLQQGLERGFPLLHSADKPGRFYLRFHGI